MKAVAGMVMIQATTMLLATRQRTAETRRAAPTPMMQPVMVWVVETGMPSSGAAGAGRPARRGWAGHAVRSASARAGWHGGDPRPQDSPDLQPHAGWRAAWRRSRRT